LIVAHFPAVNGRSSLGNGFFVSACLKDGRWRNGRFPSWGTAVFCLSASKAAGMGYLIRMAGARPIAPVRPAAAARLALRLKMCA
jgi:hypothetical protein